MEPSVLAFVGETRSLERKQVLTSHFSFLSTLSNDGEKSAICTRMRPWRISKVTCIQPNDHIQPIPTRRPEADLSMKAYHTQLKRSSEELSEFAIPTFNDQLTNSRIRSCQIQRVRDTNPWNRREVLQLGFGLFHLCMNFIWVILHVHRGSLEQPGSLTYFFSLLDKTRLGGEHPDYHTLHSALTQVLHGLLLNINLG